MRMWGTTRRALSIRWDWIRVIASSAWIPALLPPATTAIPTASHRTAIPTSLPIVREGAGDQGVAPAAVVVEGAVRAVAVAVVEGEDQRARARLTAPSSITTTGRFTP